MPVVAESELRERATEERDKLNRGKKKRTVDIFS